MALEWSFSTDRRIRRCQRQFFFWSVAAWHNAKDPLRRESTVTVQEEAVKYHLRKMRAALQTSRTRLMGVISSDSQRSGWR
jgi:hypothetical protein